jgi:hypothetical protein
MIIFSEYRPFWIEEHLWKFLESISSDIFLRRGGQKERISSKDQIDFLDDFLQQKNESEGFWCLHGQEKLPDSNDMLLNFNIFESTTLHDIEKFLFELAEKYSWVIFPWKGDDCGTAEVLGFINQDLSVIDNYLNTLDYCLFDEHEEKKDRNRACLISKPDISNENLQFTILTFREKNWIGNALWETFGLGNDLPFAVTIDVDDENFGRTKLQKSYKKDLILCASEIALIDGDKKIVPNYSMYEIADVKAFRNFTQYYNTDGFAFFVPNNSKPENVKKITQILIKGSSEACFVACASSVLSYADWVFFPADTDIERNVNYLICKDSEKLRMAANMDNVEVITCL